MNGGLFFFLSYIDPSQHPYNDEIQENRYLFETVKTNQKLTKTNECHCQTSGNFTLSFFRCLLEKHHFFGFRECTNI